MHLNCIYMVYVLCDNLHMYWGYWYVFSIMGTEDNRTHKMHERLFFIDIKINIYIGTPRFTRIIYLTHV